jgi:hypothetical protein
MRQAHGVAALFAMMMLTAGCGLAYEAASEHRATKMENELTAGLSMAQVREKFGQPDIEDKPDDITEIWSYAKHANNNDVTAEVFYTSAKEGDAGTFEDLKFVEGNLVSWTVGQHTMAEKDSSGITTSFGLAHGGGRHGSHNPTAASGPPTSSSSDSSGSTDSPDEGWPTTY